MRIIETKRGSCRAQSFRGQGPRLKRLLRCTGPVNCNARADARLSEERHSQGPPRQAEKGPLDQRPESVLKAMRHGKRRRENQKRPIMSISGFHQKTESPYLDWPRILGR